MGIVRGITVRSRSIVGNIELEYKRSLAAILQAKKAREQAFERMLEHAEEMGANAIVAMRYDATEVGAGITEVPPTALPL